MTIPHLVAQMIQLPLTDLCAGRAADFQLQLRRIPPRPHEAGRALQHRAFAFAASIWVWCS